MVGVRLEPIPTRTGCLVWRQQAVRPGWRPNSIIWLDGSVSLQRRTSSPRANPPHRGLHAHPWHGGSRCWPTDAGKSWASLCRRRLSRHSPTDIHVRSTRSAKLRLVRFPRGPFLKIPPSDSKSLYPMLEAALQETNAARDHMLLLGCGTAEEKFAEFIISWRARIGARQRSLEFGAVADVPQGCRGLPRTHNRNRLSGACETRARTRRSRRSQCIAIDGVGGTALIVGTKL